MIAFFKERAKERAARRERARRFRKSMEETTRYWPQIEQLAEEAGVQPYISNSDAGICISLERGSKKAEDWLTWFDYEAAADGIIIRRIKDLISTFPR